MKSRTLYFDKTVLRKDLTRFSPLWALYLIGGLLIMHLVSGFLGSYYSGRDYSIAQSMNVLIGPMGIFSACYGFLAAQLLFGDLHNTRLCYGIHAFPLRREGWYLTHVVSGLLMGLVPSLVIILTLMPMMGAFWYTGLLCFGGLALHYLFFFGLAVFCMICTGNRFASTAVYGILNFLALIVQWFTQTIYLPLLPGVRASTQIFNRFCPFVELVSRNKFMLFGHAENCPLCQYNVPGYSVSYDGGSHEYVFQGLGGDWRYLLILAGVGIALLAGALLLYRIRHLERAGDFIAFKPMKPIFLAIYSLCVGCVLFYMAYEISGEGTGYLFFAIGIFIGYFTGKMLLERTLRVFKSKSWIGLGILYAAVLLSLLLTWIDPAGISRRIPKAEKVEAVYLFDGKLSDYQINNPDNTRIYEDLIAITNPEGIETVRQTHRLLLEGHNPQGGGNGYCPVTLHYVLKNGTRITRTYYVSYTDEGYRQILSYLRHPQYLFGVPSAQQLQELVSSAYMEELGDIPAQLLPDLMKAMWLDAEEGQLSINVSSLSGNQISFIELRLQYQYRVLYYSDGARHINQWLKQHRVSPSILLQNDTLEQLLANTNGVYCGDFDMKLKPTQLDEFLKLLWQDCENGYVYGPGKWGVGISLEVELERAYLLLYLDEDSACAQWLQNHRE